MTDHAYAFSIGAGYEQPPSGHDITRLELVAAGHQRRHQITCACGWTHRYVSEYSARARHGQHAAKQRET
jgi:hypothetical protein